MSKALFFVLGWVAEKFPGLVRDIASLGHEIGSHGYSHQLLTHMDETSFRSDVQLSIDAIYGCSGIFPDWHSDEMPLNQATQFAEILCPVPTDEYKIYKACPLALHSSPTS